MPLHAPGTEPRHMSVCYVFSCTPPAPQPCFLMFLCSKKLICNGNTSCILWDLTDRRHQKEINVQRVRQTCSFFPNPLPARSVIRTVSFLPPQVTASSHTPLTQAPLTSSCVLVVMTWTPLLLIAKEN